MVKRAGGHRRASPRASTTARAAGWRTTTPTCGAPPRPIDGARWGMWPTGGAWLCKHLWDHYDYGRDRAYLADVYPLHAGRGASSSSTRWCEDPAPASTWSPARRSRRRTCIRTAPRSAPGPRWTARSCATCSPTASQAAEILGTDADFREACAAARARLPPDRIGKAGQLQEWLEDWDMEAPEPNHRHVSHLYALYPERPDLGAPHAGAGRRRAAVRSNCAATCRPAGPSPGASTSGRGCATASTRTRCHQTAAGSLAHLSEHVRRASAVPDRRQFRRRRRHARDAAAVCGRRDRAAAGAAARPGRPARCAACARAAGSKSIMAWRDGRCMLARAARRAGGTRAGALRRRAARRARAARPVMTLSAAGSDTALMATDYPVTMAVRVLRQHQVEFTPHLYSWEAHGGTRGVGAAPGRRRAPGRQDADLRGRREAAAVHPHARRPRGVGEEPGAADRREERGAVRARRGRPPLRLPGGRHLALRPEARHAGLLREDASPSWRASTSTAARAASWWASIRADLVRVLKPRRWKSRRVSRPALTTAAPRDCRACRRCCVPSRIEHLDRDAIAELAGTACAARRTRAARACASRRGSSRRGCGRSWTPCPSRRWRRRRAGASCVTCAMSCAKLKVMSTPASGWPKSAPLMRLSSGRCTLPSRQASPSSSGVTATGENAVAGFDW